MIHEVAIISEFSGWQHHNPITLNEAFKKWQASNPNATIIGVFPTISISNSIGGSTTSTNNLLIHYYEKDKM